MYNTRKLALWPFRIIGKSYPGLLKWKINNYFVNIAGCRTIFIKPTPDDVPTLTTQNVLDICLKAIGKGDSSLREYSPTGLKAPVHPRTLPTNVLPQSKSELPPRTMKDSFTVAKIPLSTDMDLRNRYITSDFAIRIGRLLEDLDCYAVWTCWQHIDNSIASGKEIPYDVVVVTGGVESLHLPNEPIATHEDIRMAGHVSWVGNSSLEASIQMDQKQKNGQYKKIVDANVTCIARNPTNATSAIVNPLLADSPEEEAFLNSRKERHRERKIAAQDALIRKPPSADETNILHKVFVSSLNPAYMGWKAAKLPPNSRAMSSTILKSLQICHPEHRNGYNKIFGGFIMRLAEELATANAYKYTKERPRLLDIDDIIFRKPVEIGNILQFRSMVGYVEDNFIHIPVMAEIIEAETGEIEVTNNFHFTFISNLSGTRPIPPVIPSTYQEGMTYLQSRRHFKDMMKLTGRDKSGNLKNA